MSGSDFLEKIDDLFTDSKTPDLQKMQVLITETLKFFEYLRGKLQSSDEEEKKEAIELAKKLQEKFEGMADKSLAASGMSKDQLFSFLANSKNFSGDEWNSFKTAEKEITDYRKEVLNEPEPKKKKPSPKSSKTDWIKP